MGFAAMVVLVLLCLVAFFFPWLLKRYIETHSEEWIGRRIRIERIVLNPFTFNYGVYGFTCHEPGSDTVFVSWDELSVKGSVFANVLEGNWAFHDLVFDRPYVRIVQQGSWFNFSDLLPKEDHEDPRPGADPSEPFAYGLDRIQVRSGRINYTSDVLKEPVSVLDLRLDCDRISSTTNRLHVDLGCGLSTGGDLRGGFGIDAATRTYGIDATLTGFGLAALEPYLQEFFACRSLAGELDVRLLLHDSWADTTSLAVSGAMELRGLELIDPRGEPLQRVNKATVVLDTLTAEGARFDLNSVLVDGAHTRFVMNADSTDNWTSLIRYAGTSPGDTTRATVEVSESNVFVMLADYLELLGEGLVMDGYSARDMRVTNSSLDFEDHLPAQPFRFAIREIALQSGRSEGNGIAPLAAQARLGHSGRITGSAVFDPGNYRNVTVDLQVDSLSLHELNAYGMWYAAHPLLDGMASYSTATVMRDGTIDSRNHIRITQMQVDRRMKQGFAEGIYVLPLRLAVALLKDRHGNIELDVPVKGDLNDPKFKVWPIVWQVLKNLVTKIIAAPVTAIAAMFDGADPGDLEQVRYSALQVQAEKPQRKAVRTLAQVLKERPGLAVDLVPITDTIAEEGRLAVRSVKEEFLRGSGTTHVVDSARLAALADRDSSFLAYLDQRAPDTRQLATEERCRHLAGASLRAQWNVLEKTRQEALQGVLVAEGVPASGVRFRPAEGEEARGRIGAPGYRIIYREAP